MTGKEIQSKLDHYGVTRYQLSKQYGLDQGHLSRIISRGEASGIVQAFFTLLFEKLEREKK